MAGGLRYENVGQMPTGMRHLMVEKVLAKVHADPPAEDVMEVWYCYGKGGLCATVRCAGECCPYYDGRGARKPNEEDLI